MTPKYSKVFFWICEVFNPLNYRKVGQMSMCFLAFASYQCICLLLYHFGQSQIIFVSNTDPPTFYLNTRGWTLKTWFMQWCGWKGREAENLLIAIQYTWNIQFYFSIFWNSIIFRSKHLIELAKYMMSETAKPRQQLPAKQYLHWKETIPLSL